MIRRWLEARRLTRHLAGDRQQLLGDTIRVAGYMEAIVHIARTVGMPDTVDAVTSLAIWRMFVAKVRDWADEQ